MKLSKKKILMAAMAVFLMISALSFAFSAYAADTGEKTVFLSASKGSDKGDGSLSSPYKSLKKALEELNGGGTLVLTDKYILDEDREVVDSIPRFTAPKTKKEIVITSLYGGVDYRKQGASLHFKDKSALILGGDTVFENVTVSSDAADAYIAAAFNNVTYGGGFKTTYGNSSTYYFLYAIGGYFSPETRELPANKNSNITINDGTFKKVIGFTHVKGIATYTFTGTSYIKINGGRINELFGASNYNHYSGSTEITVNGGSITKLYSGGDATRRLDGQAKLYLNGGTVKEVLLNNVLGNVDVTLEGADVRKMSVSYGSDAIKKSASGSIISLRYNSVVYKRSEIDRFSGFHNIENFGNVYLKEGTNGTGVSPASPLGDINKAISLLADGGGDIVILGEYTANNITEPERKGEIKITGKHGDASDGRLILSGSYTSGGGLTFENITIVGKGNAEIDGNGHSLTVGDNVATEGELSLIGCKSAPSAAAAASAEIIIKSGAFQTVSAFGGGSFREGKIIIYGGSVEKLIGISGGSAKAIHIVSNGEIASLIDRENGGNIAKTTVEITSGTVKAAEFSSSLETLTFSYAGGRIEKLSLLSSPSESYFKYNGINIKEADIKALSEKFSKVSAENVIYIADKGEGNGLSPETPISSLASAFRMLKNGGYAVLVDSITLLDPLTLPKASGSITVTSKYDGVDYREKGAMLSFSSSISFSSSVTVEELAIENTTETAAIMFGGNKSAIGKGIISTHAENIEKYPDLVAGDGTGKITKTDLTVESGIWNEVTGGSTASGAYTRIEYLLTVKGGEFYGKVLAVGKGTQSGSVTVTVSGGTFYSGLYGTGAYSSNDSYNGTLTLNINGGIFYGKIAPGVRRTCKLNGKYIVNISGGDFIHLTDIAGTELYQGNSKSSINIGDGFDAYLEPEGSFSWINPLRRMADPRIIKVDGLYYFVYTTGSVLSVYKAANIPDLAYSVGEPVWDAREVSAYLEGRDEYIWPSKLMYYSEEEFGEDAGWYLLFTTYKPYEDANGNVQGDDRRSYILKSASSDLQGDWVNPETGEKNIPAVLSSETYSWVNTTDWTAGQTTFRHEGKNYCIWIEQRGRGTADFAQRVYLSEMKNPWTLTGEILELIVPEYDWEREGFGYSTSEQQWYPAVIEGLTPVHNDKGDLFIVYAGSGYWTPGYCLGQMTFHGGDILDKNNWTKSPTPIFKKNSEVCGVGGPSIITSPDGNNYLLYHAYLGSDTTGYRYCFMEPYYVDETGFHVGKNNSPSPLSSEFSIEINSMPVIDKISGFDSTSGIKEKEDPPVTDSSTAAPDTSIAPEGPKDPEKKKGQSTATLIVEILCIAIVAATVIMIINKALIKDTKEDTKEEK